MNSSTSKSQCSLNPHAYWVLGLKTNEQQKTPLLLPPDAGQSNEQQQTASAYVRKTQYPCGLQHMNIQKQGGVSPPLVNRERERVLFIYKKWLRAFIHAGFTNNFECCSLLFISGGAR
jgi:hypothetical protein